MILVSGPVSVAAPPGARLINVESALQMKREVEKYFPSSDIVVFSAAVSDYRAERIRRGKIKTKTKHMKLNLVRNPDILLSLGKKKGNKILIGFALETENVVRNAKKKLAQKNLDMIIANTPESMGGNRAKVSIIAGGGKVMTLAEADKTRVAEKIITEIGRMI